jgi:hypothetical protein
MQPFLINLTPILVDLKLCHSKKNLKSRFLLGLLITWLFINAGQRGEPEELKDDACLVLLVLVHDE